MLAGLRQVLQQAEAEGSAFAGLGYAWHARKILAQLPGYPPQQVQTLVLLGAGIARPGAVTLRQDQLGLDLRQLHALPGVQNAARPFGRIRMPVVHLSTLLIGPGSPLFRKIRCFLG